MKHIHAELMAQYAQDAMETDSPWERWERMSGGAWVDCWCSPGWFSAAKYRRKPQTITRTITYPKPLSELPEGACVFYIASPNTKTFFRAVFRAVGDSANPRMIHPHIRRGLVHATKEAAIAHGKALAGVEE